MIDFIITDGAIVVGWLFSAYIAFGLLHLIRKLDGGV